MPCLSQFEMCVYAFERFFFFSSNREKTRAGHQLLETERAGRRSFAEKPRKWRRSRFRRVPGIDVDFQGLRLVRGECVVDIEWTTRLSRSRVCVPESVPESRAV